MSDITSELIRLSELKEKGLITQEEFDAAKAQLLGRSVDAAETGATSPEMPSGATPPPITPPPVAPPTIAPQPVSPSASKSSQTRPSALRPQPASDLPPGIKGWSWGAFLWNWIWAIFNNTWIGLLALIPGVNLVMIFVLGAKGREWAWKNKKWDSVEHFNRVQRKWSLWGIWLVVIGFVLALLVTAASMIFMGVAGSKMSNDFMEAMPTTETTDTPVVAEDATTPMTEETTVETVAEDAAPVVEEEVVASEPAQTEVDTSSEVIADDTAAEDAAAAEQERQQAAEQARIKAEADAAKAAAAKAKKDALKAEKALAEKRRREEEERRAAEELAAQEEQMRCPYSRDQPLNCSSHGSRTAYCDWNFRACGNPRISKKESKTTCNGKVSWDPDNDKLIVTDGCRALFIPVE